MTTRSDTETYTIKQVSDLTGLPSSTLRYYETIGIVKPIKRDTSSKQRVYSEDDLTIIDAIACLSATGMSINNMKIYLDNRSRGAAGADMQIELLRNQQKQLEHDARMVTVRQDYVQLKIKYWQMVKSGETKRAKDIAARAKQLTGILKHPRLA